MRKMSIGNLFNKSRTSESNNSKILIILLILIVAAGAFYWWGYPLLFPASSVKSPVRATTTATTPSSITVAAKTEINPVVKEKTLKRENKGMKKRYLSMNRMSRPAIEILFRG